MNLFKEIFPIRKFLVLEKAKNRSIGFVPTMGALHKGHLSLISHSISENDITVCSIFVNPTQFNNPDDLKKYPRNIENDIRMLLDAGCDILFHPEVGEMYPEPLIVENTDYGIITTSFEGKYRPGHYAGVVDIVSKLFDIITPDRAYFGQKDFQQCAVITEMIRRNGLPISMRICETIRETDGLAMSSRNTLLDFAQREAASCLPKSLLMIKERFGTLPNEMLVQEAIHYIHTFSPLMKVEYLDIVDANSLAHTVEIVKGINHVVLLAVWCGNVRLIDNMLLQD